MSVYKNGNTIVEIKSDGTKIRYVPDNQVAMPLYPESIDLKITNKCFMDPPCPMCHEQSGVGGFHGNLNHPLLDSLHPYTELALGGGDPITHPDLEMFLRRMRNKQVICNITVHWKSFVNNFKTLKLWNQQGLIHGIGVSVNEIIPEDVVDMLTEIPTVVIHTIAGIAREKIFEQLEDRNLNILILGYKFFGRGIEYKAKNDFQVNQNIQNLEERIFTIGSHFRAISFDNLAIKQLNIKEKMSPEAWKTFYMGDDGTFTMYIDLVKNQYAVSSTSIERNIIDKTSIDEIFYSVKQISK